jgi:hypothetical protein
MRIRVKSLRVAAPVVAAVCSVSLLSGTAWAGVPSEPLRPPRQPASVSPRQCHAGHGHVARDRGRDRHRGFHCVGGRFNGHPIRF